MLNTIPQDPSSVMRFVDGADERQLMSMVSSKNPYSFMALAKLQSIRDAKMKEQAGQPMPPPMSEQIPQQLAQLASGQQPQQQPMQQPQQPMQPQGIASIGGEPNGAGGGMVSFTDGGGVRRFAEPNGNQLVTDEPEKSESTIGKFFRNLPGNRASEYAVSPEGVAATQRFSELSKERQTLLGNLTPFTAMTPSERNQRKTRLAEVDQGLDEIRQGRKNYAQGTPPVTPTPVPTPVVLTSEQQKMVDAQGGQQFQATNAGAVDRQVPAVADSGIKLLNNAPPGAGNLNPAPMYKKLGDVLAPLQRDELDAQAARITALTNAQTAMSPYYDPKRLAEFNPTDEVRETSRQAKQTALEKEFPNPYTKTANTLELLQKNLENAEGNTFNKALLKASLTLMGNKSSKFFQAAAESGLVGVEDYGRMQEANQKQRMALMNADTALATAQDSRKRGLYDQSAKQVSESLQFKKDAFLAEREATFEKGKMAIALKGEEAKIPALKIQHAQDLFTLQHNLLGDKIKIAELNQRGAQIAAANNPEVAKIIEYAYRNPGLARELYDERFRSTFTTFVKEAMEASTKDQMSSPEQKKANIDAIINSALENYRKQFPRPVRIP